MKLSALLTNLTNLKNELGDKDPEVNFWRSGRTAETLIISHHYNDTGIKKESCHAPTVNEIQIMLINVEPVEALR